MKKSNAVPMPIVPQIEMIPLSQLMVSPTNPRKSFSEDEIQNLAQDIYKNGLLHPITLRKIDSKKYEIVVGSRRYRAYSSLGALYPQYKAIPAFVRELNDDTVIDMQFSENIHRADVNPLEEAEAFKFYVESKTMTAYEIAERLNHNVNYVYRRLSLNNLNDSVKDIYTNGGMTLGIATLLAKLPYKDQDIILKNITSKSDEKGTYVYRTEDEVRRQIGYHILTLNEAPFDISDDTLIGGSCLVCSKNTGCNKLLFPEITADSKCTDKACFKSKTDQFKERQLTAYKANYNGSSVYVYDSWDNPEIISKRHHFKDVNIIRFDNHKYELTSEPEPDTVPVYVIEAEKWQSPLKKEVNRVVYLKEKPKGTITEVEDDEPEEQETPLEMALDAYDKYLNKTHTSVVDSLKEIEVDLTHKVWLRFLFMAVKPYSFDILEYYVTHLHDTEKRFTSKKLELKWLIDHEEEANTTMTGEECIKAEYAKLYVALSAYKNGTYFQYSNIKESIISYTLLRIPEQVLIEVIKTALKEKSQQWYMKETLLHSAIELGILDELKDPILP